MNKKTITLVMMLLLTVVGAKATVIFPASSEYYSEPAEGTYYLYNVTENKFMNRYAQLIDIPTEIILGNKNGEKYSLTPNDAGRCLKMGKSGSQMVWRNDNYSSTECGQNWFFTEDGSTKTYYLSITADKDYNEYFVNGTTYYLNNQTTVTSTQGEANKWVLITPANYRAYIATLKANAIPSTYYSTLPTETDATITGYLYDVVNQIFIDTQYAGTWGNNQPNANKTTITKVATGYLISGGSVSTYLKYGGAKENNVWCDGAVDAATSIWEASKEEGDATNTYIFLNSSGKGSNGTGCYLYCRGNKARYDANADFASASYSQWALITEANWYNYLATTTATIPATYYTATPAAGTNYYLYNPYSNCFLYDGANYVSLRRTPEALKLTANGVYFDIQLSDNGYLKYGDGGNNGNAWCDGNASDPWAFVPFHDATGLFFLKNVGRTEYLYANASEPQVTKGALLGSTPETNNTKYAWALISATDYANWQNSFTLDEATGYSATKDIYNVNPTVNRTMTANVWNTLVVPFDMAIPSGWTVKEPTAFDGITITFSDASSIVAGKPYIVKPTADVTSFSATNVTLKKDLVEPTPVGTGTTLTMTGTYTKIDAIPAGANNYVIGIKDGVSKLYLVDAGATGDNAVSCNPFRAYFTVAGAGARSVIDMAFGDESTGISSMQANSQQPTANSLYYDLQGRRVNKLTKGLYIKDGKKVLVK